MELTDLESLLGVVHERVKGEKVILPPEKYHLLNEPVDRIGTTRLMQAARCGALECADLLLTCGAEVDARDVKGRMAIDHCLRGDQPGVTLLLLRWDSLLPSLTESGRETIVQSAMEASEEIKSFFSERDGFHEMLKDEDTESLERVLNNPRDRARDSPRRWVNSRGESALYSAASGWKCDSWALLKASGFAYASEEERRDVESYEADDSFLRAIGKHFVDLGGCHVQKMVARSKVYKAEGVDEEWCGERVNGYFKDIDGEEITSDLLRCLQDEPTLEIVFDFTSTDIQSVHPTGNGGKVFGLVDYELDRIYVAAKETDSFDHSDVVSNLVHELTHKALSVVFENGGLPYRKGDEELKEEYGRVVQIVLYEGNVKGCDRIIRRAGNSAQTSSQELIVRVPEMISKYRKRGGSGGWTENGVSRLLSQAPTLLKFYEERVRPEMRQYVSGNRTASKVPRRDLLKSTSLLTSHYDRRISVSGSMEKARVSRHNQLALLRVSNLKLGVSHLRSSLEDVTFVDWTRFQSARNFFRFAMSRNEIGRLAVVWDKAEKPPFCRSSICTSSGCIAKKLRPLVERTILMVPKRLSVPVEAQSVEYSWDDLSGTTRKWILEKELNFGGTMVKLKDVFGGVGGTGSTRRKLGDLLEPDDLSALIEQDTVQIGRPLQYILKERGFDLLREHPECLIPRALSVRHLTFSGELFERRRYDAFVIINAKLSDVVEAGIAEVHPWRGEVEETGRNRCFVLDEDRSGMNESHIFGCVARKLKDSTPPGEEGGEWRLVHFFRFKDRAFHHLRSLDMRGEIHDTSADTGVFQNSRFRVSERGDLDTSEALILADAPGSGKSVFANETAREVKEIFPEKWVDVVELTLFEKQIGNWGGSSSPSGGGVEDLLYELLKDGESQLERKLLKLFCRAENKSVVFFDGFDEICPDYKDKFTSFLEALMSETNVKVCLTTRTHEYADLQKRLTSIVYRLVPLDRVQQVDFLNREWKSSLKALPQGERARKIEGIVRCLQSHRDLGCCDPRVSHLVEGLKSGSEADPGFNLEEVDFEEVAERVTAVGYSTSSGEGDFSGNPLQAWMIASVTFEENFNLGHSLGLPQLYDRFLGLKIDLYSREKAKSAGNVAGDSKDALFRFHAYELLKKFSASFFLEDARYELKSEDVTHVLRMGLVTRKSGKTVFVHRTFGEYLFSLWLFDKVEEEKVTMIWLTQVLLENKFQNVREFVDGVLLSSNGGESWGENEGNVKKCLLNRSAFPTVKDFAEHVQKGLYKSILECREGILNYLADSCGDSLAEVMFAEPNWDMVTFVVSTQYVFHTRDLNALTFCGQCIHHGMLVQNFVCTRSTIDFLGFLPALLGLVRRRGLTAYLNDLVRRSGLEWTGVHDDKLWGEEEGRTRFAAVLGFFAENREAFGETLRREMFLARSRVLFRHAAEHSFDALEALLDSILEDVEVRKYLLLEGGNFLSGWMRALKACKLEKVQKIWEYLERKLASPESKRVFLLMKDSGDVTALFAAGSNSVDPRVFPFVWGLCRAGMSGEECTACLFDAFNLNSDSNLSGLVTHGLLSVLGGLLRGGHIGWDEVARLLLGRDRNSGHYLLGFDGDYSLPALYELQDFLLEYSRESATIVGGMEGHYARLNPSCFGDAFHSCLGEPGWPGVDPEFDARVERDFQEMLDERAFVKPIPTDEEGNLVDVFDEYGGRIEAIRLKAFLVLLRRQLSLEEKILGRDELARRLKREWFSVFKALVPLKYGRSIGNETRAFVVPQFFALLSETSLSKEQVAGIILEGECFWGTAFHRALDEDDLPAFFALYDASRRSMCEDALWRVHGVGIDGGGGSVLELLLCKEGDGLFCFYS